MNIKKNKLERDDLHIYIDAIPKTLEGSAIGYEIIELPNSMADDEEGYLSIGFMLVGVSVSSNVETVLLLAFIIRAFVGGWLGRRWSEIGD